MRIATFALLFTITRAAFGACSTPVFLQAGSLSAPPNFHGLATADFDKDGKLDYVVTYTTSVNSVSYGKVAIYFGHGDGTFDAPVTYTLGSTTGRVLATDLDGDTYPDLAVLVSGDVSILLNNHDRTFSMAFVKSNTSNLISIEAGDFNGDGIRDLVVAGLSCGVLIGTGGGKFSAGETFTAPLYGGYGGSYAIYAAAVDRDGDGKDEIALLSKTSSLETGELTIVSRTSAYNFTQQHIASYPAGGTGDTAHAVDLNNDGAKDLVAGLWGSVTVWTNDGSGNFGTAVTYDLDYVPRAVVPVDLDADGDLDLALGVINDTPSLAPVMLNAGDGTFGPPLVASISFPGVSTVHSYFAAAGDITGDGRPEILLGDPSDGVIHVVKNSCPSKPTATEFTQSTTRTLFTEYVAFTGTVTTEDGSEPAGHVLWFDNGHYRFRDTFPTPYGSGVVKLWDASLKPGEHTITIQYEGTEEYQPSSASVNHTVEQAPFGPPQAFRSDGDNSHAVNLSWIPAADSAKFEIWRMSDGQWTKLWETDQYTYRDETADPTKGYFYRVRAVKVGEPTTLTAFTAADPTLVKSITTPDAGAVIRAADFEIVREGVNRIRAAAGLGAFVFSEPVGTGLPVKASHIKELWAAFNEAMVRAEATVWPLRTIESGKTTILATDLSTLEGLMW